MASVKPSGTLRIAEIANKLKAEGRNIISFTVGEPDFNTPRHIIDAAHRAMLDGFTHYTPAAGIPELREAVANKSINENRLPATAANVMVSPTKQAIFSAILANVEGGNEVVISNPAWVSYEPAIAIAGGRAVEVPLTGDDFRMTPESVMEGVTPGTKMIILNSPSNPTGGVARLEDLKGIADIATDHDLLVLSDEIYEKLVFEGEHHSIASLPGMFERTITVNGLSKSYAMTGWRIGWAVAPEVILRDMIRIQEHSLTCCTSFAQKGAVAALTGDQSELRNMVSRFAQRRKLVMDKLSQIDGMHAKPPAGAFYLFPKFDYGMTSRQFTEYLLSEANVAVMPGSAFGSAGEGHVRMSFATSEANIETGFDAVAKAVSRL